MCVDLWYILEKAGIEFRYILKTFWCPSLKIQDLILNVSSLQYKKYKKFNNQSKKCK